MCRKAVYEMFSSSLIVLYKKNCLIIRNNVEIIQNAQKRQLVPWKWEDQHI